MKCIIVDDEPLGREAIEMLVEECGELTLVGKFNSALSAQAYMQDNEVDLVLLDIHMPGVTGLEFARTLPASALVIFTTAYGEHALESYDLQAVDYLVKPVLSQKFRRAVDKAVAYHRLLVSEQRNTEDIEGNVQNDHFFVRSERRFFKVAFDDIFFIEALKDYVIIQLKQQRIITKMTIKALIELLPSRNFMRVNRSYIVNTDRIDSFDTNDIFIGSHEIAIGVSFKDEFFKMFLKNRS